MAAEDFPFPRCIAVCSSPGQGLLWTAGYGLGNLRICKLLLIAVSTAYQRAESDTSALMTIRSENSNSICAYTCFSSTHGRSLTSAQHLMLCWREWLVTGRSVFWRECIARDMSRGTPRQIPVSGRIQIPMQFRLLSKWSGFYQFRLAGPILNLYLHRPYFYAALHTTVHSLFAHILHFVYNTGRDAPTNSGVLIRRGLRSSGRPTTAWLHVLNAKNQWNDDRAGVVKGNKHRPITDNLIGQQIFNDTHKISFCDS